MLSNKTKSKYLHILSKVIYRRKQIFTQKEIAGHLNVSLRKYSSFETGNIIDLHLLSLAAEICGYTFNIDII